MGTNATSRRDLLRAASTAIAYASGAAIVGTGMALASEAHSQTIAVAGGRTPFRIAEARYWAADARLNALPSGLELRDRSTYDREERAYLDAVKAVDTAPVSDWQEFADAFEIACDGGASLPNDDLVMKLLADVRRLSGRA